MTLTAENVGLYAETLVRQVQAGGFVLDFAEGSLVVLDRLFEGVEEGFSALPRAQQDLVVFYNGCYLGQVFVCLFGAEWQFDDSWFNSSLVILVEQKGIEVRPFEKVLRRLTEGAEGNLLSEYVSGLKEHLARPVLS